MLLILSIKYEMLKCTWALPPKRITTECVWYAKNKAMPWAWPINQCKDFPGAPNEIWMRLQKLRGNPCAKSQHWISTMNLGNLALFMANLLFQHVKSSLTAVLYSLSGIPGNISWWTRLLWFDTSLLHKAKKKVWFLQTSNQPDSWRCCR